MFHSLWCLGAQRKGMVIFMKKPLVLMILDGFGIAPTEGNAIAAANKPNLDKIFAENPHTQIGASGMDVGLPDGQMGNSEVLSIRLYHDS